MSQIELTVHSVGNGKYRFYIPSKPSRKIFKKRRQDVTLIINNEKYPTHTTCGPIDWNNLNNNQKKGYDLYSSKISKWIIENKLHFKDSNGKCQKVEFIIGYEIDIILLTKKEATFQK
jgi:hypothetical protein